MSQPPKLSRSAEIKALLEAEIERGELVPGAALDERALAARFNVSRTPIREALQQLAAQQYVQIVPRQGVFVIKMTVPQLRDMLELLNELEAVSARLAARRMNDAQRVELQRTIDEGVDALNQGDARRFARSNAEFHEVICDACHNDYLADQIRSIRRLISRYRPKLFLAPSRREKVIADHQKLAQALLSGDEATAEAIMAQHSPGGEAGFSEFLATLPAEYFNDGPVTLPRDTSSADVGETDSVQGRN
ncbi:transcriptional regulator, GntR family [Burkholderia sp. lig30]|jgi:DNA-binding GntR family transcriptional regulator|uniref:GntR family transcriptional regulator n=1 Tax=Burkholderia sp. lig30 TaxID=1192124 RepID=UPI0004611952|nr:GntR family transcriptional regulator [Burkholderia sp. lig30]KDB07248.1 transcriptional regulator, GntR family [Burkholderia sp. lig30]